MAYEFDGKHQRRKPQDGPEKMLQIFDSVGFDPVIMGGDEYYQGTSHCRIQVIRRRQEPRDQTEEIGNKDEKP
jgi:hypothetical protein